MAFKYFIAGFLTKAVAGFDDMLTHIPLISYLTKTRLGKIAFAIGILLAVLTAITIAKFFSALVSNIPGYRYFLAGIIFALAVVIYFDIFKQKRVKKTEKGMKKIKQIPKISRKRFLKLMIMGYIAAIATALDDIIVYSPLFQENLTQSFSVGLGIFMGGCLEAFLIVFFSKQLRNFKFKKEISSAGLLILSILILFKIL